MCGTRTIQIQTSAPAISIDDVSKAEGNSGTTNFTFTVSKSGGTARSEERRVGTAGGTPSKATESYCASTDGYLKNTGTLKFAAGDTYNTITSGVCDDVT